MKVYFEPSGTGFGKIYLSVFVNPQKDGSGFHFRTDGTKYQYWWADPKKSKVFNSEDLPKDLWYSIQHGVKEVKIPKEKMSCWTLEDLIYDKIEKEWIEANREVKKRINKVKSLEDFKKLYPLIKKSHFISHVVIDKLLSLKGISDVPVYNGEIGIAYFQKSIIYRLLLEEMGLEEKELT